MRRHLAVIAVAVLALSVGQGYGGPGGMLSLPELTSAADAIVVAAPDGPPEPLQNLRLVVRRVVKGDPGLTTLVTAWPDDVALPAQPVDFYGLWFLKREGDRWSVLPPVASSRAAQDLLLTVPEGDLPEPFRYAAGDPGLDKVVQELRAAVFGASDTALLSRTYDALATVTRPQASLAYEHIGELGPGHVEACPTVRLIREWDASVTESVYARLQDGQTVPAGLVAALCTVDDAAALPALSSLLDLLGTGLGEVQRCVAKALRNIHSEATLPLLARLLDAGDPESQYFGVSGFALFANNYLPGDEARDSPRAAGPYTTRATLAHGPSIEEFFTNMDWHVEYWRTWQSCVPCRLDQEPPNVSITSPASGALLSKTELLFATTTDDIGVAGVTFLADATAVGDDVRTPPYELSWDSTTVADGLHVLTATARDHADNVSASAPVSVTVDNTPPAISTSPAPATLWPPNGKMVPITLSIVVADALDPRPRVALVSITCDDACDANQDIAGASFGADDRQFELRAKRRGSRSGRTYTITYSATDAAGNTGTGVTIVVVPHDQSP